MATPRKIPESKVREISVAAPADPRTVKKLLGGKPVSPLARQRIVAALVQLGIPVPPAEEQP